MYMLYIWLAIIVIGLLVELIVEGSLVTVWFSIGAVIPFCMSFSHNTSVGYIIAQVVIFGVVTALCLIFLRKLAKKLLYRKSKEKTNLDVHVGKSLKVLSISDEGKKAVVKLNDIEYTAVSENEEDTFEVNEQVEMIKFKGNKIVVKKKGE